MSAFFSAGESFTPSPVTATMAPWRWHPSTMISFCWGEVRANTISGWLRSMSSISAGVMSRRSLPWTTHAFAFLLTSTLWTLSLNNVDQKTRAISSVWIAMRVEKTEPPTVFQPLPTCSRIMYLGSTIYYTILVGLRQSQKFNLLLLLIFHNSNTGY